MGASGSLFRFPGACGYDPASPHVLYTGGADQQVRKIDINNGAVTHVAGRYGGSDGHNQPYPLAGPRNPACQDGPASSATFGYQLSDIAIDAQNDVGYVCDSWNHAVRKVTLSTGYVTRFLGPCGYWSGGPSGQGQAHDGTGLGAGLSRPSSMVIHRGQQVGYIADTGNQAIRKVDLATAAVTTPFGRLRAKGSVDGTGTAARFSHPQAMAIDEANNMLYVSEHPHPNPWNVRKIDLATGLVTTVYRATDPKANVAGITVISRDVLYISLGHTIAKLVVSTGQMTVMVGKTDQKGAVDGVGAAARLNGPARHAYVAGKLYVADSRNHVYREISPDS